MSSPIFRIMALEKRIEELERVIDAQRAAAQVPQLDAIVPAKRPVGRPPHKGIN